MHKQFFFITFYLLFGGYLTALPTYSFRSARVCDNCHVTPFNKKRDWENPVLKNRKCNMSCQTCHINPAGGGLRNASGRYYTLTTLPTWGAKKRPYHDKVKKREIWQLKNRIIGVKKKSPKKQKINKKKSSTPKPVKTKNGSYPEDFLSFGAPLDTNNFKNQSKYALWDQRYGPINPDPFLTFGADARVAFYSSEGFTALFPMQYDIGTALHPIEHVTVSATAGLQGRTDANTNQMNIKLQNAFLLIHELPYMAYLQAGYFLPEFGLRVDDHTMYGRENFEMDTTFSDYNVAGAQIGFAPNYPYASASTFQTLDQNYNATGFGFATNFAYRGIEWGLASSYMQKTRDYNKGGDLYAVSLSGYYNLWSFWKSSRYTNPIIFQFEYNIGRKPRSEFTMKSYSTATYMIDYLVFNGFNMRMSFVYYDQDFDLISDGIASTSLGFDWTIYRFIRFSFDFRTIIPDGGEASTEMIIFVHSYI